MAHFSYQILKQNLIITFSHSTKISDTFEKWKNCQLSSIQNADILNSKCFKDLFIVTENVTEGSRQ